MDPDAALDLLKEILAGVPRLTGAACVGRHELFDPVPDKGHRYRLREQIRRAEAARLCAGCPAIRHCTSVTINHRIERARLTLVPIILLQFLQCGIASFEKARLTFHCFMELPEIQASEMTYGSSCVRNRVPERLRIRIQRVELG